MSRILRAKWLPLLVATVVGGIVLGIETRSFGGSFNVYVILQTAAFDAVVGLAQMVVLAVGDMSLAVGGIGGLVTIAIGNLVDVHHWPVGIALVVGLLLGTLCGVVNGVVIARTQLSGFIVTLATGSAFTGIAYGVTSAIPYSSVPSSIVTLSQGRASFFPYLLLVAIAATALVGAALRWLPDGRTVLAVGGNRDAATLSGLSRTRALVIAHGSSGLLAGVAAVMYMGVLQSATPATGTDWLIISFAVPIIGGTALTGGEASSVGGLVAAVVLATINDALIVLNVNTNAVEMAEGLLILAAVLAGQVGRLARLQGQARGAGRSTPRRLPPSDPGTSAGLGLPPVAR